MTKEKVVGVFAFFEALEDFNVVSMMTGIPVNRMQAIAIN
jgi:hypothetical protein